MRKLWRRNATQELCVKTTLDVFITPSDFVKALAYRVYLDNCNNDNPVVDKKYNGRNKLITLVKDTVSSYGMWYNWDFADADFQSNLGIDEEEGYAIWAQYEEVARKHIQKYFPEIFE